MSWLDLTWTAIVIVASVGRWPKIVNMQKRAQQRQDVAAGLNGIRSSPTDFLIPPKNFGRIPPHKVINGMKVEEQIKEKQEENGFGFGFIFLTRKREFACSVFVKRRNRNDDDEQQKVNDW